MKHPTTIPALALGLALVAAAPAARSEEAAGQAPAAAPAPTAVEKLDKVRAERIETDREAQAAQQRINRLDDETQKMLADYRKAVAEAESHDAYAKQLAAQTESQQQELTDIERQLAEIEDTSRSIVPLQQKMLATLAAFVDLDIPFLVDERKARVATLEAMMNRADVSISEKYRRIVEAYQVELDYGRTIEAYEARLAGDSAGRTARFLRVGRVALLYQTLDGRETGYWDNRSRKWVVDDSYAHAFKEGVAVAQKTSAPELLLVPVPSPEEAKS